MNNEQTEHDATKKSKFFSIVKKVFFLLITVLVVLVIPLFIQYSINVWFRDTFQHSGIILIPGLRVLSTLVCYVINASVGWLFLHFSGIKKRWLNILFFVLVFLWTVFFAMLLYILVTS